MNTEFKTGRALTISVAAGLIALLAAVLLQRGDISPTAHLVINLLMFWLIITLLWWVARLRAALNAGQVQRRVLLLKLQDTRRWLQEMRQRNEALPVQVERQVEQKTTHLKRSNRELRETNQQLEAFNYMVSHDMRASLRVVDGFTKILVEDLSGSASVEARQILGRIQSAVQHMQGMVVELLALSRSNSTDIVRRPVDLGAVAAEVLRDLQLIAPQRSVDMSIDANMHDCAEPALIREVLQNLLGNAWKFTATRTRTRIQFGVIEDVIGRTYYVRDNGVGFDMERVTELFQPFHRLHSQDEFEGSGIGLATVKRIVERHGGRVWAVSNPDHGAKICFTLGKPQSEAARQTRCG